MLNKKKIRNYHLDLRMKLSTADIDTFSNKINTNIIDLIKKFNPKNSVGLFYPYKKEVDVLRISKDLIKKKHYMLTSTSYIKRNCFKVL